MINISIKNDSVNISHSDRDGEKALNKPLHRVFFRSLKASPDKSGAWNIAPNANNAGKLVSLIEHLERYKISFNLDPKCRSMLDKIDRRKSDYQKRMESGLALKHGFPEDEIADVQTKLSDGFLRTLTLPQKKALIHLNAVGNGANFSVPGSGKTSVVLAYFDLLKSSNSIRGFLVVGPISSFQPWEDEFEACFGRKAISERISGKSKLDRRELYMLEDDYEMLLVSYQTLANDVDEVIKILSKKKFLVVLDESHYIKKPVGGKMSEAVISISKYAYRRVLLTGTPMPNGLPDLWSQCTFLWPEQLPLGTADSYLRYVKNISNKNTLQDIKSRIDPLFFRVTKRDLGLPKPSFKIVWCDMKPLQSRIYSGVAERFLSQSKEAPNDRLALKTWRKARSIRLLQIAANPTLLTKRNEEFKLDPFGIESQSLEKLIDGYADYEVPVKIEQACAIANEICASGQKVVIWSTFIHNLNMLDKHLKQFNPVIIHGGIPYGASDDDEMTREAAIKTFKTDDSCKVLIANPAACAESISLHMICHAAIYMDRSFNCAHFLQSLDRIHRLGLPEGFDTTYYIILARDTIDGIVHERLETKTKNLMNLVEVELPEAVSGYWTDDLGEEGERDFSLVEEHIRSFKKS